MDCGMAPPATARLTAIERKRERDKLNQRSKRRRELEHIASLEERIRYLEQEIRLATTHPVAELRSTAETQALGHPSDDANDGEDPGAGAPSHPPSWPASQCMPSASSAALVSQTLFDPASRLLDGLLACSATRPSSGSSGPAVTLALEPLTKLLESPEWMRLPLLSYLPATATAPNEKFASAIEHLRATPSVATTLPTTPKALDLLFGGSRNDLADLIVSALAPYPVLLPEKFALSWLVYRYFRWYIAPSPELFAAIPAHMRPTTCQLVVPHPVYIVAIIWPGLRDQMALHCSKHNLESVFGLLSCTVRVRGFFNANFIKRENGGEPQVDEAFLERFTKMEGWGILERFWSEYPELVEGIDGNIMIREEHLLPV
jgi:hypothetical protein